MTNTVAVTPAITVHPALSQLLGPPVISLTVLGLPAPQGSKTPKGRTRAGRIVMVESSRKVKPWREAVQTAALLVLAEAGNRRSECPLTGPLLASMTFSLVRPQSHYRSGRHSHLLREDAPARPTTYPDLSKLLRSTEDALTDAGVWGDDSQVVGYHDTGKFYAGDTRDPGVLATGSGAVIRIWMLQSPTTCAAEAVGSDATEIVGARREHSA